MEQKVFYLFTVHLANVSWAGRGRCADKKGCQLPVGTAGICAQLKSCLAHGRLQKIFWMYKEGELMGVIVAVQEGTIITDLQVREGRGTRE